MANTNRLETSLLITAGVEGLDYLDRAIESLGDMGANTDLLRDQAAALRQEWDSLSPAEQARRIQELGSAYNRAGEENRRMNREAQGSVGAFGRMKGAALALGAALAGAFALGKIKAFFAAAVSGAADLQQQLATVQAVSGATAEELAKIKAKAEELGASTRFSATQAAQGFETLARSGLSAQESIQTLPSVLALAQGNSLDLAEAAGFITNAVNGMGMSFDEAARVADVLAAAAANANTDVQGMGQALSYAAPVANSLGLSIEETAAYMGKFADAGIDASRAGTAFNSILSQFKNPASTFRRELAAIGINTTDFNQAVRQLAASGAVGQKAILALGQEAGPAFTALLSQGIGSLDSLTDKLNKAGGTAANQAAIMDNTWQGALEGLKSAWQSLKDSLGESFLDGMINKFRRLGDAIREVVGSGKIKEFGAGLARLFDELSDKVVRFVETLDFKSTLDSLSSSFDKLRGVGKGLNGAIQALNIGFQALKSGVATVAGAFAGFFDIVLAGYSSLLKGAQAFTQAIGKSDISQHLQEHANNINKMRQSLKDYSEDMADVSIKAGQSMMQSLDSIAGKADETAQSLKQVPQSFAEAVAANVAEMTAQLQGFGLSAQSSAMAVSDVVSQIMGGLSKPEQFAALSQALDDLGIKALAGVENIAALNQKAIDSNTQKTEQAVAEVKRLYSEEEVAAIRAKQAQEQEAAKAAQAQIEAAQAARAAWAEFGIDVEQIATGISSEFRDSLGKLDAAMVATAASGERSAKVIQAAYSQMLSKAQTAEEFKALSEMMRQHGQATAAQMQQVKAGMQGGAEAVKAMTASLAAQNQGLSSNTAALNQNTQAARANAAAKNAAANAGGGTGKNESKEEKATQNKEKRSRRVVRANYELKQSQEAATEAVKNTAEESRKTAEAMLQMAASAKNTADSIAASLAELRGDSGAQERLAQEQKINELQAKMLEAQKSGNAEAARQYQRAIGLQKQLYQEKQIKAQEQAAAKQAPEKSAISTPSGGSSAASLSAADVAKAWDEKIKAAEQRGAEMGKQLFAQELFEAAKRKAV